MHSLPFSKLNETNYDDWKLQMEALLERKNVFGVVNGRDTMPLGSPNSKAVRSFVDKQRLARAEIILALEASQLPHVRAETDPAIIWNNLAQIHRARGLGVLLTMRRDFIRMQMAPDSSIASFVASIRHAAYRLEESYSAENEDMSSLSFSSLARATIVSDLDKISVLLNGLPPAYQSVIVNITGTPLAQLNFESVVTRLLNEEGRLRNSTTIDTSSTSPPDEVLAVTSPGGAPHWKQKSQKPPAAPAQARRAPICHKCGGVGHLRNVCPTRDIDAIPHSVNVVEDSYEASTSDADEDLVLHIQEALDSEDSGNEDIAL